MPSDDVESFSNNVKQNLIGYSPAAINECPSLDVNYVIMLNKIVQQNNNGVAI